MDPTFLYVLCSRESPYIQFCVTRLRSILGRAIDCDFVVDDTSVSRRHAEIRRVDTGLEMIDLRSRNGTFIANLRKQTSLVASGQIVRFGNVEFTVSLREAAPDRETEDPAQTSRKPKLRSKRCEAELSEAQHRVFQLLREGLPEKTIAKKLGLSTHTIHNHTRAVFQAFGVHSRVELLATLSKASRQMNGETV